MRILLLALFSFVLSSVQAAPPAETVFKHLGISEGFSQTNVTSLYQDETGTVWAAGVGGVFRYRGLQTDDPLVPRDHSELFRPLNVKGIIGEQRGRIYFYQLRNVIEYDLRTERFTPLFTDSLLDGRQISAVCIRNGVVYAAASDRILLSTPDRRVSQWLLPPMSEVSALTCTTSGELYAGTLYSGVYRIDRRGNTTCVLPISSKISSLFEDRHHNLWVCTRSEGLYCIDTMGHARHFMHETSRSESLADNYVRCICEDREGRMWIGMMFGLDCYDPASDTFHHYGRSDNPLYGMRNRTVECILCDRHGTVWFGSFYTGISYFYPHEALFQIIPIEDEDTTWTIVADVALDKRQNVWAGTSDKGLYFYDMTLRKGHFLNMSNSAIPSNNVKAVRYDRERDQLWLGMFMGGVCVYDIASGRFTQIPLLESGGRQENTEIVHGLSLYCDTLYAGAYAGIYRIPLQTRQPELIFNQQRVFQVLVCGGGWLYAVINQVNFCAFRRNSAGKFEEVYRQLLQQNLITNLFCDRDGRAWVGTTQTGALCFDRNQLRLTAYDRNNCGMASNHVSAVTQTASGLMVFGTNTGLSVVDPHSHHSENFNARNGFPLLSLENGCLWRGVDGEIIAGGVDGIVSFHEQGLVHRESAQKLFFASLSVNEHPVQAGDKTHILKFALPYTTVISLGHKYTLVDIAVGTDNAIDFNPGDYQYRLTGYDETWRTLTDRNIRYMSLPAGHYSLVVRARPTKLFTSAETVSLRIRVYPPFYASFFAYVCYVLLIMGATALVIRYYYSKKQLEQSLALERMALEQQQRITQWKLVFFTNISHEFRTPLTLIQGQLDLLVHQSIPENLKSYLASVRRNVMRLRDLVNELIDFRKQEQGYMSLKVSRQDLVSYLREVCEPFAEYSRIKHIAFDYHPAVEHLEIYFDPIQLQKVFYNLIGNAFKHTEQEGSIRVDLTTEANEAVIRVRDTGHGIDPKNFSLIFERFYHNETVTQEAGMGIGLSLSKGVIELHGGTIEVESKIDVGSTFTVRLPASEHFENRPHVEIVESAGLPPVTEPYLPVPERIVVSDNAADLPCLLVVEDDDELRGMFGQIFSQTYRVTLAANGAEGLKLARENEFDLIVSDVLMPEMSGTEMCAALKSDFATCHIPIILLTALSSNEQRIAGLKCGADDYIGKPFDADLLLVKCNGMVRNRRLLQRKFLESAAGATEVKLTSNSLDEAFVNKTLALIGDSLDSENLGVGLLSRELAMSRTALFSKIKGVFGQTPTELIQSIRLREAARMLSEEPDIKIAEIADRVGINSQQYFGKLFRAHFGRTPSEYRAKKGTSDGSQSR